MKNALSLLEQDENRSARALVATVRDLKERRASSNTTPVGSLDNPTAALFALFGGTSKSGATVSENTAFNVSVFTACTNILAQSIAMLPIKVGQKTANGPVDKPDHPAARLLKRKPGVAQTSYIWRSHKQTNVCLGGNGYSQIHRSVGSFQPGAIEPLKPCDVQVVKLKSGRLGYDVRSIGLLQDYEVVHVRGLTSNGWTGRSPLRDMRDNMGLSMTAQEFTSRTFANGNRKPGVFIGGPTTTPDKAREFSALYADSYAGAVNAGKNPFLVGGVTWMESGFSNADAELLMSRRFEVEEISRFFRVPLHLLNSTEKSTTWGSGIDQLNQGFVAYTLQPWLANWEMELEDKLLTEAEKDAGYYISFNLDVLLRGSPAARAAFYETLRRIGAMDVNQIRELEEWDLYPDSWAGDPRMPLNAQQSGNAVPTAPAVVPVNDSE